MSTENQYCEKCKGTDECSCNQEEESLFEVVGTNEVRKMYVVTISAQRRHGRSRCCPRERACDVRSRRLSRRPRICKAEQFED